MNGINVLFNISDIQYKVSYGLLRWVYTDEINIESDSSFLLELLRAATRFKLEHLRQRYGRLCKSYRQWKAPVEDNFPLVYFVFPNLVHFLFSFS